MKKIITYIFLFIISLFSLTDIKTALASANSGEILLQVQKNGEAWYVYPRDEKRYFLGRPADAFLLMKRLSLGAKHDFIADTDVFPSRLSGIILLDAESHGEAYYIYPRDRKKYYLGRPDDAFMIMQKLGLGITDQDLAQFSIGDIQQDVEKTFGESKILLNVPFSSQAPYGGWSDQRQQDGCEEVSALMAVKWAKNESVGKDEALREILAISDFIQKKYGEYRDISIADTMKWILNDYFDFYDTALLTGASKQDIIRELQKGNLMIAPMNGRLLKNPNFTPPGPINHMLVIRGYDPVKNIFITNEPGTRKGEAYEYDTQTLLNAIRDYPTGYHEPNPIVVKDLLVIRK